MRRNEKLTQTARSNTSELDEALWVFAARGTQLDRKAPYNAPITKLFTENGNIPTF